ncbi:MAG: hypothetical protein KDA63_00210 [Planctomycetales bacterium]|nr:hypothetical protein [Planctomycetales bacterium]
MSKTSNHEWKTVALDSLAQRPRCGYKPDGAVCAEPTAMAALALAAHDRPDPAAEAVKQLAQMQQPDGAVGVSIEQNEPVWPTGLAVIAWQVCGAGDDGLNRFQSQIDRAIAKILEVKGQTLQPSDVLGHDVTLQAWPWVQGTHSWIEPTTYQVLALKLSGLSDHPRCREAVDLLIDRLLPDGGCNYGNTFVLGNKLRPHLQPSGLALLALRGESDDSGRLAKTVDYVRDQLSPQTTPLSLSFALLGLAAQGVDVPAEEWLAAAYRANPSTRTSPYKSAMLLLAAARDRCPLTQGNQQEASA